MTDGTFVLDFIGISIGLLVLSFAYNIYKKGLN